MAVKLDYWRQLDILDPNKELTDPVTVIGAGGIGSPTVLALSKMGVGDITVYDGDTIENHNLPNQVYRCEDITKNKVDALTEICESFGAIKIKGHAEHFTSQPIHGIVISGVDSMESRKAIWERVKFNPSVKVYIEARMGAEVCRLYTVNTCSPSEIKMYERTLYDDDKAIEAPCTAQAVIYNVFMIAGLICNQVKKFAKGETVNQEIIFDLKTMTLLTA